MLPVILIGGGLLLALAASRKKEPAAPPPPPAALPGPVSIENAIGFGNALLDRAIAHGCDPTIVAAAREAFDQTVIENPAAAYAGLARQIGELCPGVFAPPPAPTAAPGAPATSPGLPPMPKGPPPVPTAPTELPPEAAAQLIAQQRATGCHAVDRRVVAAFQTALQAEGALPAVTVTGDLDVATAFHVGVRVGSLVTPCELPAVPEGTAEEVFEAVGERYKEMTGGAHSGFCCP
jgi:hypothetical protein